MAADACMYVPEFGVSAATTNLSTNVFPYETSQELNLWGGSPRFQGT